MIPHVPPFVFWAASAAVAISLGLASGPIIWRAAGETGQLAASVSQTTTQAEAPRLNLSPILGFAPFGSVAPAETEPEMAGETSLGLTLLGVTIATPANASRAIIRGGDTPVQSYGIGANINANAKLIQVNQGHVVLEVEGRLETLSFVKPGEVATSARGRNGPDLRNLIPRNDTTSAPEVSNEPDAVIARYRAAIHQDANGVLNRLGVELTDQGYRIAESASVGVRQAGFRPGDVVRTVNGEKVGDMESDLRYFDEVAASGRARVELERDGQKIFMTFPLQ